MKNTDQRLDVETHHVFNQPEALEDYNAFTSNHCLQHYVSTFGGQWGEKRLIDYGKKVGHELLQAGFDANRFKPEFQSHDRFGHRIDRVDYHPAYHQLMTEAINAGHHNLPWVEQKSGAHVVRAGIEYLHTHADPGSGCPLTMTFASVPALKHQPDIAQRWLPKILSNQYNPDNIPYFEKEGLTIGMAMTEKQGGSDVRANASIAEPIAQQGAGQEYLLTGHKWFCSAPMCDGFLMLAQSKEGLSCFLMPRWRPDGEKNNLFIQRLKNKMGNVSNASSEIEFRNAFAWMIGEPGRGVRTILQMVAMTRFDCMVGSSSLMGLAASQAIHHTAGRSAFGKPLHQQPLMKNVLADLGLESEAALALSMRLAHSLDNIHKEHESHLFRLGTALGKYWICKRTAQHTYEAMESIGGVAVVEDNVLARLYREAPINAIWEGSGNIQCLDVVRAIQKEPRTIDAFVDELERAKGRYKTFDEQLIQIKNSLSKNSLEETALRQLVEQMAIMWQATTLLQFSNSDAVNRAFVDNRLEQRFNMYGTLHKATDFDALLARYQPKLEE